MSVTILMIMAVVECQAAKIDRQTPEVSLVPANDSLVRDIYEELAAEYERMGDARMQQGDFPGAEVDYQQAIEVIRVIDEELDFDFDLQSELWICHCKLAYAAERTLHFQTAIASYDAAIEILQQMLAGDPINVTLIRELEFVENCRRHCEQAERFLDFDLRGIDPRAISLR